MMNIILAPFRYIPNMWDVESLIGTSVVDSSDIVWDGFTGWTIAHGDAHTERSLSENKKFLTKEKSTLPPPQALIGLRLTKDAIKALGHGDPNEVPISRQMLKRCEGACTKYERELKERREQELLRSWASQETGKGGRTTEARESKGNQGE